MLRFVLNLLGLAPDGRKTGKREAAWALILIALTLTLVAMFWGEGMVSAMTAILVIIWPSAILAVAGAYKLQHDVSLLSRKNGQEEDCLPPPGFPGGS